MLQYLILASVVLPVQDPATRPSVIVVPSAAFPTIWAGVQEAYRRKERDEVLVLPGVYRLTRTIHVTGRLRIRSAAGPKRTIIEGRFGLRCMWILGGTRDILIEGFTLRNGWAPVGGAIQIDDTSPRIRNCIFVNNHAFFWGGAISILGNQMEASPSIEDCRFEGNTAGQSGGAIGMGAVSNRLLPVPDHRPVIRRCQFNGNQSRSSSGGGFYFFGGNTTISDCWFSGNNAFGRGVVGSVRSDPNNSRGTMCHLVNCVLSENRAKSSILQAEGATLTLTNCVVSESSRAATVDVYSRSYLPYEARFIASNSVLWTMGPAQIRTSGRSKFLRPSFVDVAHSDVRGGWPGRGNIDKDPMLANAASGNARLLPGSPCIDAGTARNVPRLPKRDFEGDPRWIGPAVDIGADEWNPSARLLWTDRAWVTSNAPVRIVINVQARRPSEVFIALPSLSGTKPGFSVGRVHIPLNPDGITTAFWRQLLGTVDARGRGQRVLSLRWVPRELAGRNFSFAAVFLEFRPKGVLLGASNADTVRIR